MTAKPKFSIVTPLTIVLEGCAIMQVVESAEITACPYRIESVDPREFGNTACWRAPVESENKSRPLCFVG